MKPGVMTRARLLLLATALLLASTTLYAAREFRVYRSLEAQADTDLPDDYRKPGEFVVGRLMYPPLRRGFGLIGGDWREGGTSWAVDYPRADRTFAQLLRRLTSMDVRSVEQPVSLDDGDDVFDWPFMLVGLPGNWDFTEEQAKKLREYLLRGGFLLCDSFYGTQEWQGFEQGIRRVFPDRPIVDLPADHPIFHTVYDLSQRKQVAIGYAMQSWGVPYRDGGAVPYWGAILDDAGRVMVVIVFNNDLGDSWQWADDPGYPSEDATFGIRMGVNFAIYAMTH
jgi:hypothetical protein